MGADTGTLEKMTIQGYKDEDFSSKAGSAFEVMINPESYSHKYSINYTKRKKMGGNTEASDFNQVGKEKIDFKLMLDSTGAIPLSDANKGKSVKDMVKELKGIVYDYHGDIHQPYFVELIWGSLIFKGRLETFSVEYKMFTPTGDPVRANISMGFAGYMSEEQAASSANNQSPDMTHMVQIKEGDTLPMLCQRIYGRSKYYLKIAEINQLSGFRNLIPGTTLLFPPLK